MSDTPHRLCTTVRSKSSSYLDGRMSAEGRRVMQQHLNSCSACMQEIQALAKLSRATHNLPQHRTPSDMASRVRQRMAAHRSDAIARLDANRWRTRGMLAAAAALLVATGWATGFWMGQQSQSTETTQRDPAPDHVAPQPQQPQPAADVQKLEPRRIDPDSFRLASRNVLQDLEVAPSLPEHAQAPLIEAQLAYFELPQRAEPILRSFQPESIEHRLAVFVTELQTAISGDGAVDWMQWHQRAKSSGLLRKREPLSAQLADSRPADRATTIVERVPSRLNDDERKSLAELLVLKHERLAGKVTTSVEIIEQWQGEQAPSSPFTLATGTEHTRALVEIGRHDDAKRMLRAMRTQMRRATHSSSSSSSSSASASSGASNGGGGSAMQNRAEQMLEEMMRELGMPRTSGGN